ncbi:hypothetical protein MRB53_007610 [Persea americana]|uniref:Uncharacterized protein n=1 Tax=Persea americana TaxID=3435 RepID=A0ACC2MJG6_PERAE|nr:hypothetical protein MRB53_007610 [Persea americana]
MGASGKEESVLKLVHPGRFMEIHRRPVKASEVIEKNPRHCVTRPDVFKFPWIVVSPDSILEPGNVFYIVPNHTIHRLLQTHDSSVKLKPYKPKGSTPKNRVYSTPKPTQTQPIDIPMDSSKPERTQGSNPKKLGPMNTTSKWAHLRPSPSKPPSLKSHPPDPSLKRSQPRSRAKVTRPHPKQRHIDDNTGDQSHGERLVKQARGRRIHQQMDHGVSVAPNKQHDKVKLKPCLSKEGQKRSKPQGLKVRFQLSDVEDKEKLGGLAKWWPLR